MTSCPRNKAQKPRRSARKRVSYKAWLGFGIAFVIIFLATLVSTSRLLAPYLNGHLADFEQYASQLIGRPVTINNISLDWQLTEPILNFNQVAILDPTSHQPIFNVNQFTVNVNWIESLLKFRLIPDYLRMTGFKVGIKQLPTGDYKIADLATVSLPAAANTTAAPAAGDELNWLFSQPELVIRAVRVQYQPLQGPQHNLVIQQFTLENSGTTHHIKGQATVEQKIPVQAAMDLTWQGTELDLNAINAHGTVTLQGVILPQWLGQHILENIEITKGVGNTQMQFTWTAGQLTHLASTFDIQDLELYSHFTQKQRFIAIKGVQGDFSWNGSRGKVQIDGHDFSLNYPAIFANPLTLTTLSTNFILDYDAEHHQGTLTANKIKISNPKANATAELALGFIENQPTTINLTADFNLTEGGSVTNYLPLKTFDPDLVAWLNQAFQHGQVTDGKVVVQGNVKDFPFDKNPGKFLITGKVDGLTFHYAPGWPALQQCTGVVTFAGARMDADISSATVLGAEIQNIHGEIPYIGKDAPQILAVNGAVTGDLADAEQFIQQSGLKNTLGKSLQGMALAGPMQLNLQLSIPLRTPQNAKVTGQLQLQDMQLKLPEWHLTLDHLTGPLTFTEKSVQSKPLTGKLWSSPLTLQLSTTTINKNPAVTAQIQGQITVKDLAQWSAWPLSHYLQGSTKYTAQLQLFSAAIKQPNQLIIQSNLQGITLNLPYGYTKKASTANSFKMTLNFKADQPVTTVLKYVNPAGTTDIKVASVKDAWQVTIANNAMNGTVSWPIAPNKDPINARFKLLTLPSNTGPEQLNLKKLPALDFYADELRYQGTTHSHVTLNITPSPQGLIIKNVDVRDPEYQFAAAGEWQQTKSSNMTHLQGTVKTPNVSKLLQHFGFQSSDLVGSGGVMQFDLTWPDTPFKPQLATMAGNVGIKLSEGRIVNLSQSTDTKIGVGRMLNLLNLQTLPRRLNLDFSDLSHSGYSFDSMQGDYTLNQGNVFTKNTQFDGSVARIDISGRIGLVAKDYDLYVSVTPFVTGSLPVVATIAGGPVAGIATWMVERVAGHAVANATTYHYAVTGTWDKPVWVQTNKR